MLPIGTSSFFDFACLNSSPLPLSLTLAGATLCSEDCFSEVFFMSHSSTFAGGALASRVGLRTLDMLMRNDGELIKRAGEVGGYLIEQLKGLQAKSAAHRMMLKDVREIGRAHV